MTPTWLILVLGLAAVIPTTIASIAGLIVAIRTRREVNGIVTQRVIAAHAEGRQAERDVVQCPWAEQLEKAKQQNKGDTT